MNNGLTFLRVLFTDMLSVKRSQPATEHDWFNPLPALSCRIHQSKSTSEPAHHWLSKFVPVIGRSVTGFH